MACLLQNRALAAASARSASALRAACLRAVVSWQRPHGVHGLGGQGRRDPRCDRLAGNGVQRRGLGVLAGAPARRVVAVLASARASAFAPAARAVDDLAP